MKRTPARQLLDAARPRLSPKLTAIAKEMEALELDEMASCLRSKWGDLNAGELQQLGKYFKTLAARLHGELERRVRLNSRSGSGVAGARDSDTGMRAVGGGRRWKR